jgi:hypothetical protein
VICDKDNGIFDIYMRLRIELSWIVVTDIDLALVVRIFHAIVRFTATKHVNLHKCFYKLFIVRT